MTASQVVDKIISQEQAEVQLLRQIHAFRAGWKTYIQNVRPDKQFMAVPDGDKILSLGGAELGKGVELEPLEHDSGMKHRVVWELGQLFSSHRNLSPAASCR